MLFAERIKAARDSLQLSQKEVAKAIGVDVPMYSRGLSGANALLSEKQYLLCLNC